MVLVTGVSGFLGAHVALALQASSQAVVAWRGSRAGPPGLACASVDLLDPEATARAFDAAAPTCVIHGAAEASLGACAADPARAFALNAQASERLAQLAQRAGARFVLVSSDMVFDGEHAPYSEDDTPDPTTTYGRSKLEAERRVLAAVQDGVVARVPTLFGDGLTGRVSSHAAMRAELLAGRPVRLFHDEFRTPLEVGAAARALVALAHARVTGCVHLPGPERLSRLDMGRALCRELGASEALLLPVSRLTMLTVLAEPRPRDLSLRTVRAALAD